MPKVDVYDIKGKKVSDVELAENIFGIEPNEAIVHSVLVNYLANQRQGTQSTKTRAEVRGGGRKPWRQKGTGRIKRLQQQQLDSNLKYRNLINNMPILYMYENR